MRIGRHRLELVVEGPAFIVHRGVSQVKINDAKKLEAFWQKKAQEVPQVSLLMDKQGQGMVRTTIALKPGWETIGQKDLVIVSNPQKPRVWTVKRLRQAARRVSGL